MAETTPLARAASSGCRVPLAARLAFTTQPNGSMPARRRSVQETAGAAGRLSTALWTIGTDGVEREALSIARQTRRYVDEMQAVRERHLRVRNECMAMTRLLLCTGPAMVKVAKFWPGS